MMWWWGMSRDLAKGEHPDNQCPERGPALSHIMDPLNNFICRFCRVRLNPALKVTRPVDPPDDEVIPTAPGGQDVRLDTPLPPAPNPFLDVNLDDQPLVVAAIRLVAHPLDPDVLDCHVPGMMTMPHSHVLEEDWPHARKQRLARHIGRWHFRP